ncbi:MAG: 1-acyl-sn-glycerol-3-phosphate acyltransferase [Flavobacteriaceae bacterium]
MQQLSKFILERLWGWKIEGSYPDEIKKFITIAVPHTHWEDFPLGVLFRSVTGRDIKFLAKASLFKGPFGWFFKWQGGFPINRSKSQNKVDSIIEIFDNHEAFALALSPEGTRKKVTEWKTGFYYIAKGAGIPIIGVAFDFEHKTLRISKPFYPGEDPIKDIQEIKAFFKGVVGRVPEYS